MDKDARNVDAWTKLGAGMIEVGTITPEPQPGNPSPTVSRDNGRKALWNRLGFPSQGLRRVHARLKSRAKVARPPLFANIGKNAATPLDQAAKDYVRLVAGLRDVVDGFVVNISSPNTKGLRELLRPAALEEFLTPLLIDRPRPVLLKLSPDMADDDLAGVLDISARLGIDGWVLTNSSATLRDGFNFPEGGGVSGRPLGETSRAFLKRTLELLGPKRLGRLIISVGGVMNSDDVAERLAMGADLVQVYSALIFEGPFFLRRLAACPRLNPRPS